MDTCYFASPTTPCNNCETNDYILPKQRRNHLVCCPFDISNTHPSRVAFDVPAPHCNGIPFLQKMSTGELTECDGCYNTLIVGSVPRDLFIPLPGINVWNRHIQYSKIGKPPIKYNYGPYTKNLTLCLNCFNGHVSGRKPIPFDVLGISIVKTPHSNTDKYLKIEGPTKLVNLLSDDYKSSHISDNMVKEGQIQTNTLQTETDYRKPRLKRKISTNVNYVEDDDDDIDDDIIEQIPEYPEIRDKKESRLNILDLGAPTTLNYLTIGNDMLGAMEMTDD
uniref:Uncharacterized protein n=1 Tax=Strigamia maritima TaxID=126957 RepID=T1JEC9_STRMM